MLLTLSALGARSITRRSADITVEVVLVTLNSERTVDTGSVGVYSVEISVAVTLTGVVADVLDGDEVVGTLEATGINAGRSDNYVFTQEEGNSPISLQDAVLSYAVSEGSLGGARVTIKMDRGEADNVESLRRVIDVKIRACRRTYQAYDPNDENAAQGIILAGNTGLVARANSELVYLFHQGTLFGQHRVDNVFRPVATRSGAALEATGGAIISSVPRGTPVLDANVRDADNYYRLYNDDSGVVRVAREDEEAVCSFESPPPDNRFYLDENWRITYDNLDARAEYSATPTATTPIVQLLTLFFVPPPRPQDVPYTGLDIGMTLATVYSRGGNAAPPRHTFVLSRPSPIISFLEAGNRGGRRTRVGLYDIRPTRHLAVYRS